MKKKKTVFSHVVEYYKNNTLVVFNVLFKGNEDPDKYWKNELQNMTNYLSIDQYRIVKAVVATNEFDYKIEKLIFTLIP